MDALNCSARLDTLPLEIIFAIIELLSTKDVMHLSQANKYLRGSSLPYVFRKIAITFSLDGFEQLKEISESPIHLHVVSLKYVVPELIDPDMCAIDDYKRVITPDLYVTLEEEAESNGLKTSSYMAIYNYYRRKCSEQQEILENRTDLVTLSAALAAFPKLTELAIWFHNGDDDENWLDAYRVNGFSQGVQTYVDHLITINTAVQAASKSAGLRLKTLWMFCCVPALWMNTRYYDDDDFDSMRDDVEDMLQHVELLGLGYNMLLLMMLPAEMPSVRKLHIRDMSPCLGCIGRVLDNNANITRVRLQNLGARWQGKVVPVSPSLISSKLRVPQSSVIRTDDHGSGSTRKDWTVLLDQRKVGKLNAKDWGEDHDDTHEIRGDEIGTDEDQTDDDTYYGEIDEMPVEEWVYSEFPEEV